MDGVAVNLGTLAIRVTGMSVAAASAAGIIVAVGAAVALVCVAVEVAKFVKTETGEV